MMRQFIIAVLFIAVGSVTGCRADNSEQVSFSTAPLSIVTQDGQKHDFIVEVAETRKQLERGLMFRESLADDKGMIFLFPDVAPRSFWMKNTLIFLDMVFVDEAGGIVKIHPMAQPHDTRLIASDYPAKAVIELRGGLTGELGISVNDRVEFKAF